MKVYAIWHGGHSYSPGTVEENIEEFDSMSDAMVACDNRYYNRDGSTPAVDETSGMCVYFENPQGKDDPYPDRLIIRTKYGNWKAI